MLFKTHLAFSFLAFLFVWPLLPVEAPKWLMALAWVLASVIADIDSSKSKMGRFVKPVAWIFGHRRWLHSFSGAVLLTLIVAFFSVDFGFVVFGGYVSHLLLDMFNHQGIAPFYPFVKTRVKGPFKTGGLAEKVIFLISLAGILVISF